jgi:DnaK suppressor protein
MDDERVALFARLTAEREDAVAQVAALAADLDGIIAAASLANIDDEHDPEGTTIAYERAHVASLRSDVEARLRGLDAALARLAAGDYGRCASCGKQISAERLTARPAATTCITCASR